ncbi:MAG: hypothetical protein A2086_06745, partial [Spirochaetes bacterium GWD1_27_9]
MKKFFNYPIIIVGFFLVITVFFALQLPKLKVDNDVKVFIPDNDEEKKLFIKMENDYGNTMEFAISVTAKKDTLFTVENFKLLNDVTESLKKIATVTDATTIINTSFIEGVDGEIRSSDIAETLPQTEEDIARIKERLFSWDLYKNSLYSEDLKSTMILLKTEKKNTADDDLMVYNKIKETLKNYKDANFDFKIAGFPVVNVLIGKSMQQDVRLLIPLVLLVVLLVLFFSFKNIGGVVLPILTVVISSVWAIGLMSLFKINLTLTTTVLPVLLMATGTAYAIHLISHYYDEMVKQKTRLTHEEHLEIILVSLKKKGAPILLAGLTTVAGFGSLIPTTITSIRNMGIFTTFGIIISLLSALTLIPSLLILRHSAVKVKPGKEKNNSLLNKFLVGFYHLLEKHKITIIIAVIVIMGISIFGMTKVVIGLERIKMFKDKNTEIRISDEFINKTFAGTTVLNVLIDGGTAGSLANPEILKEIENLGIYLSEKHKEIGKIISFSKLIKRMNLVMHSDEANPEDFDEIPYDPQKYSLETKQNLKELITQYLLLYSGGNLEDFVDDSLEPSRTKMSILIKTEDTEFVKKLRNEIYDYTNKNFPKEYKVHVTGTGILQLRVNELVVFSQIISIIFSILIVFLILTIGYKSIFAGLLGAISLIIPISINFGLMGFLGIRLDVGTAMVASIAIGIGIDYTIHLISSYKHERKHSSDLEVVTTNTLVSSGKAIIFNALS